MARKIGLIIIFATLLFNTQKVSASSDDQFLIDFNIEYEIYENSETLVKQKITITNQQNDVVPTNYTFVAKQMDIFQIESYVNEKKTEFEKRENDGDTEITVPIGRYAIGRGRKNEILIIYKTKDIAYKNGDVWNVYIPRITLHDKTSLYNVKISVPKSLGPKLFFTPEAVIEKDNQDRFEYYLTKETFTDRGVSAAFGKYQGYNFRIKYQIENPGIFGVIYEITLPPDDKKYQEVSFSKIDPAPKKIYIDKDGNYVAQYRLKSKQRLEVIAEGSVKIIASQINSNYGRGFTDIPKSLDVYTKPQKYWEVDSESIRTKATELKDEKLNVIKNAQKIYDYIVKNYEYDFEALNSTTVQRKGAEFAFTRKGNWTCMEFSDLFITLSRAMGIPAREINGYAFSNDENDKPISISIRGGDLLHSWVEFYDPFYGWIQIDPTWGTTSGIDYFSKLDTNHIIFIKRGVSSEFPAPAGAFRFEESNKLVNVDYADNLNESIFEPKYEVKKAINLNIFKIIQGYKRFRVENIGGTALDASGIPVLPWQHTYIYIKNMEDILIN